MMVSGTTTKTAASLPHTPDQASSSDIEQQSTTQPVDGIPLVDGHEFGQPSPSTLSSRPSKKASVEELRTALDALGLDSRGKKDTLYKRLLRAHQKVEESQSQAAAEEERRERRERAYRDRLEKSQDNWKSFLCFDVEATCRGGKEFDWPNEIIEFPVVLVKWVNVPTTESQGDAGRPQQKVLQRVDTFHSYVKPTWMPILSDFCTGLTGITQGMVDQSPTFPDMLKELEKWFDRHGLRDEEGRLKDAAWVTDGPWDLRDFVPKQLHITPTDPPHPPYLFGQYLNIKQATQTVLSAEWYNSQTNASPSEAPWAFAPQPRHVHGLWIPPCKPTRQSEPDPFTTTNRTITKVVREGKWKGPGYYFAIPGQLAALGLGEFEGRQHSGLDDATNIARILIALSKRDHVIIEPNARTPHPNHLRKYPWMGQPGQVHFQDWMSARKGDDIGGNGPRARNDGEGEETNGSTGVEGQTSNEQASGIQKPQRQEEDKEEGVVSELREDVGGRSAVVKVPIPAKNVDQSTETDGRGEEGGSEQEDGLDQTTPAEGEYDSVT